MSKKCFLWNIIFLKSSAIQNQLFKSEKCSKKLSQGNIYYRYFSLKIFRWTCIDGYSINVKPLVCQGSISQKESAILLQNVFSSTVFTLESGIVIGQIWSRIDWKIEKTAVAVFPFHSSLLDSWSGRRFGTKTKKDKAKHLSIFSRLYFKLHLDVSRTQD